MTQKKLIELLKHKGVLKNEKVFDAFSEIDRKNFVPSDKIDSAYFNEPLPIGFGQILSQPYTVAYMLDLLEPRTGDQILEVGYGSGWQTTMLAHIVGETGHVHAFEIVPDLCEFGKNNFAKYPKLNKHVTLHCQSAETRFDGKNFDKIICAAKLKEVPSTWREQLKIGGKMVYPQNTSIFVEEKTKTGWTRRESPGFVFVPFKYLAL